VVSDETTTSIDGSLLGLDLALAVTAFEETIGVVPRIDPISPRDRAALFQSARLKPASPGSRTTEDVVRALGQGRAALSDARQLANIPHLPHGLIEWARVHEVGAELGFVPLVVIAMLGGAADDGTFDRWGADLTGVMGAPLLRWVGPVDISGLSRVSDLGYLGVVVADVHLRLAELMAQLKLPDAMEPVLRRRLISMLRSRGALMGDRSDWAALLRAVRAISEEDVRDLRVQMEGKELVNRGGSH
jgi:hypothetical protein